MKKASIIIALAYALGIILPFSSAKAEKVQYWAKGAVKMQAGTTPFSLRMAAGQRLVAT